MSLSKKIAAVVAIAVAAMLPTLWSNPYYIHLMVVIGIYAILLLGLDIVVGYVGEVSLGHAALFGIGSYTAGVLHFKLAAPFLLAVPASILVTGLFGALLALPALRVSGPYLAMVTLAFGTIIQILINEMTFLTQGPMGITIPKPSLAGFQLDERGFFWLVFENHFSHDEFLNQNISPAFISRTKKFPFNPTMKPCPPTRGFLATSDCRRLSLQSFGLEGQIRQDLEWTQYHMRKVRGKNPNSAMPNKCFGTKT